MPCPEPTSHPGSDGMSILGKWAQVLDLPLLSLVDRRSDHHDDK
jgi:hypothetical protein